MKPADDIDKHSAHKVSHYHPSIVLQPHAHLAAPLNQPWHPGDRSLSSSRFAISSDSALTLRGLKGEVGVGKPWQA